MFYCSSCKLKIKTKKCPLCLQEVNNKDAVNDIIEEYHSYEWYYDIQKKVNAKKIVLLSSLAAIIILIIVNISTASKYNWLVISVSSIVCAYLTYLCFTASTLYIRQKLLIEFFYITSAYNNS